MRRRKFLKTIAAFGTCAVCARAAAASEDSHWSYSGSTGPEFWGTMGHDNLVCSTGTQQSPIDIASTVSADIEPLSIMWNKANAQIVNNGHTIQVNMPAGNFMVRRRRVYELLQFHFHAPSEHLVDGESFHMEMHFVHRDVETGNLAVLGIFLKPGAPNEAFSMLSKAFPRKSGEEGKTGRFSPTTLVPGKLDYWAYEGSLTTPPCSEIVSWLVVREPLQVDYRDINWFTSIYRNNARPVVPANRRIVLSSS